MSFIKEKNKNKYKLGGDATRAITRGVGVTAAVPIAAHTGAVKKVRVTGGVKKEAKSARMRGENRWHIQ